MQIAETLPEEVLAKMHAAPKEEEHEVLDPKDLAEYDGECTLDIMLQKLAVVLDICSTRHQLPWLAHASTETFMYRCDLRRSHPLRHDGVSSQGHV